MTTPPPDSSASFRLLTRRTFTLSIGAASLATLMGAQRMSWRALAASGQLPGAGLVALATYAGWRRSWDLIVPLNTERPFPRTFLLYDRTAGQATVIAVDALGGYREVITHSSWRKSWDVLVPSRFPGVPRVTGLFAYDRAAGHITTFQIDSLGNVNELKNYTNWRKTWTSFAPYGTNGLLAYERSGGYATFFVVDQSGAPLVQRSYNDWRSTWDLLTNGPFTTAELPGRDVLLYDRTARQAEGLTIGTNGATTPFAHFSEWRQTWTSMQGGLFLFRGSGASMTADLMLFDQAAQELEFLDIGAGSTLTSILLTPTPGTNAWTHVTAIGPDLLLLYDRATGAAAFYATDRAPLPAPTATATPTPTPVIVPTPTITPTDRVNVRLEQGRGNAWHTYTAKSNDPVTGGSRKAYIIGVKNTSNKRIGLIHRDRSDKRTGPVFVKATEVSDAFNGMEVAGDWEARMTGSQADAPPRVILEVRYEVR